MKFAKAVDAMRTVCTKIALVVICAGSVVGAAACVISLNHSIDEARKDPYYVAMEQFDEMRRYPGPRGDRAFGKFSRLLEQHPELTGPLPPSKDTTMLFGVDLAGEAYAARVVDAIVAHGGDINYLDSAGETPIARATILGKTELVRTLIDRGADPNRATVGSGFLPPHFVAIFQGHLELVEILLAHGAVVSTGSPFFHSALDSACSSTAVTNGLKTEGEMNQMIDLLVRSGAEINHPLTNEIGPFYHAIEHDNLWAAEHLATLPGLDVRSSLRIARNMMAGKYKNDSPRLQGIIATLEKRLAEMPPEDALKNEEPDNGFPAGQTSPDE